MADFTSHQPGTFSWPELSTSDQKSGVAFYRSLFGWDVNEQPIGPSEVYSMFQLRGKPIGAAATQQAAEKQAGVPPHWNLYVTVSNAEDTAKKAVSLGGKVLAPAVRCHGCGQNGRLAGSDRRGVPDLATWQAHRCDDPQRAWHALLDRAHDERHEVCREVLHAALRLDGQTLRDRSADGVHRIQRRRHAEYWHDAQAAEHAGTHPVRTGCRTSRSTTSTRLLPSLPPLLEKSWCRRRTFRTRDDLRF